MREDFIGFTFNNIHSSFLGIQRRNQGDGYSIPLIPEISDKAEAVAGMEGQHFYSTNYTKKDFLIEFVFGPITETQLLLLRKLAKDKGIHELIFDERPFIKYMARVSGTSSISYYSFEKEGKREYYGTGSISFTCAFPYGISRTVFLEEVLGSSPSWEMGSIVNVQDEIFSSSIKTDENFLQWYQDETGEVEYFVGEEYNGTDFGNIYATSILEGNKEFPNPEDVVALAQKYGLYSKWTPSIIHQNDDTFFNIINAGDIEMQFALHFKKAGTYALALDNEIKIIIETKDPDGCILSGYQDTLLDKNKIYSQNNRILFGRPFSIPIGEHRLSIVNADRHSWNEEQIGKIEYYFLYI